MNVDTLYAWTNFGNVLSASMYDLVHSHPLVSVSLFMTAYLVSRNGSCSLISSMVSHCLSPPIQAIFRRKTNFFSSFLVVHPRMSSTCQSRSNCLGRIMELSRSKCAWYSLILSYCGLRINVVGTDFIGFE